MGKSGEPQTVNKMGKKKKQYVEIERIDWEEVKEGFKCYFLIMFLDAILIIIFLLSMFIPLINIITFENLVGIKDKISYRKKFKYEVKTSHNK